ncbi:SGNH/GDSL hydrolase family protein [Fimbriimonas ginsengisoli]|uniref:GDSL family lipase n=1 Tax=Fimbriimonas ginsengisoli Gsoil 348 TaxID=661478 RepID=A0A068NP31_FIMGI|nr:SGNH/GDSL hydrolase family protein [Fimbriimonas ginsengisoli]AIE85196.1 GDSL family lipase [Fimbriimonas ginsengisoli Gsoil 348]
MLRAPFFVALSALATIAPAQFALHDGDRVVFYGDSITDNAPYTTFVETFVLTRYPKMNVRFFNAGVGGDRVGGGWMGPVDLRLTRDLFSRKPTVVTVMLGMNDAGYQAFKPSLFNTYEAGYRHILDRLRAEAPSARVWLMQPSPFDDATRPPTFPEGYNSVLKRYSGFVSDLAKEKGYGTIDLNTPLFDALAKAESLDPTVAPKIVVDRVHPWTAGHLVMAATILKAWGASGQVSRTEIDAATGHVSGAGVQVKDVQHSGGVSWSSTEEALPFPIDRKDETVALILRSAPVEDWIGRELVLVKNLAPGNYRLSIDGKPVGEFPADVYSSGIDLSWMDTPMAQQAKRVQDLTGKRAALKYAAWRQIEFGLGDIQGRSKADVLRAIDRFEDDVVRKQHAEALPKPHRFEVTKI